MQAYIQRFEAKTETNEAAAALAAVAGRWSTNVQSTLSGKMELSLKNEHLRNISRISAAKRATDLCPEKPSLVDWLAFWSFVIFSFGALLFCLYVIHAKCHGGWRF